MTSIKSASERRTSQTTTESTRLTGRMGGLSLALTVLAFSAPLSVVSGFIPLTILFGGEGAPVGFVLATTVLLLFSIGAVIAAITSGVPAALVEIRKLGHTMKQRAVDILAFFDRPGTSNGPTEAINGQAWSTSAGLRSGSETSQTMSRDRCSRPGASDPTYTLDSEEPICND